MVGVGSGREQGTGNRTASQKGLKGFVGLGLPPAAVLIDKTIRGGRRAHYVWIIFGFQCLSVVLEQGRSD